MPLKTKRARRTIEQRTSGNATRSRALLVVQDDRDDDYIHEVAGSSDSDDESEDLWEVDEKELEEEARAALKRLFSGVGNPWLKDSHKNTSQKRKVSTCNNFFGQESPFLSPFLV
jgi:hypothetical protein